MKKIAKRIIFIIISPISFIIPKKRIIILESRSDFCDSSKTIYDYLIKNNLNSKYKIIWRVDDVASFREKIDEKNVFFIRHNPITFREKIISFYYFLIAKYTFYTHSFTGIPYNHGQIRFFLNHSCFPIKNIKDCFWDWRFNTYIGVSSSLSAEYRSKILNGGKKRMIKCGLPRNDDLFDSCDVRKKLKIDNYKKIIIWMPTFKHGKGAKRNDYSIETPSDISLLNYENIKIINNLMKKYNSLLIIKYHPAQDLAYVNNYNLSNVKCLMNEDLLKEKINLYKLLGNTDGLITDFSSVYFDYLLVDKPIGFELTDKKKYESGRGFLMKNPLDYMPGHKIYSLKDFCQYITDVCNDCDEYSDDRKKMTEKIHNIKNGKSTLAVLHKCGIIDEENNGV